MSLVNESGATLEALANLIELSMEKYWDPPILEEDFVRYVTVGLQSAEIYCHRFSAFVKLEIRESIFLRF